MRKPPEGYTHVHYLDYYSLYMHLCVRLYAAHHVSSKTKNSTKVRKKLLAHVAVVLSLCACNRPDGAFRSMGLPSYEVVFRED